jgi:hypothetical protein
VPVTSTLAWAAAGGWIVTDRGRRALVSARNPGAAGGGLGATGGLASAEGGLATAALIAAARARSRSNRTCDRLDG